MKLDIYFLKAFKSICSERVQAVNKLTPNLFMQNAVEVLSLQICRLAKHLTPLLKCNIAFLHGESIVNPVLKDSSI